MTDWLTPYFGEDLAPIANLVAVFLILVLALFASLWIWRKLAGGSFAVGARARRARLGLLDSAPVDSRRRLLLVRRDNVGHLIMTGGPSDVVVERNIDLLDSPSEPSAHSIEAPVEVPKPQIPASRLERAISPPVHAPITAEENARPAAAAPTAAVSAALPGAVIAVDEPGNLQTQVPDADMASRQADDSPEPLTADTAAMADSEGLERELTSSAAPESPAERTEGREQEAGHELDPELLRELQATLHNKPDGPATGTGPQSGDEVSLEREMSKLLNNISTDRKR